MADLERGDPGLVAVLRFQCSDGAAGVTRGGPERVEAGVVPQYRVDARARTNAAVDLFWSFRGRVSAGFTTTDLTPLGFRFDREMNRVHSRTNVTYDPVSLQATGIHVKRGRTTRRSTTDPSVTDPVTAIFRALSQPIRLGDSLPRSG